MMDAKKLKSKVLEDMITAMEDRESSSKMKGAKPILQIMIAAGEGSEGESDDKESGMNTEDVGECPGMPEEMATDESGEDMPKDEQGMPAGFMAMIQKKKREKKG